MRKLFIILFVFVSILSKAQVKIGNDGAMHPTGNYPATFIKEAKAFALSVQTIDQRDNIPDNFRDTGMIVLVRDSSTLYTLVNGTGNDNWVPFVIGSTTSTPPGASSVLDSSTVTLDGTSTVVDLPTSQTNFNGISVFMDGDAPSYRVTFNNNDIFVTFQAGLIGTFKFYILYFF